MMRQWVFRYRSTVFWSNDDYVHSMAYAMKIHIDIPLQHGFGYMNHRPCAADSCTFLSKLMSSRSSGVKVLAIFKVSR